MRGTRGTYDSMMSFFNKLNLQLLIASPPQKIDLKKVNYEIGLGKDLIENLNFVSINVNRILTIDCYYKTILQRSVFRHSS